MHVNGTAKQADDRISTPGISQADRGNSDLPARAWGAASTAAALCAGRLLNRPSTTEALSVCSTHLQVNPAEVTGLYLSEWPKLKCVRTRDNVCCTSICRPADCQIEPRT